MGDDNVVDFEPHQNKRRWQKAAEKEKQIKQQFDKALGWDKPKKPGSGKSKPKKRK